MPRGDILVLKNTTERLLQGQKVLQKKLIFNKLNQELSFNRDRTGTDIKV